MIYLFHGSDSNKARAKAFQWVAAARAKRPDAPYLRLTVDAVTDESLAEAVSTQGLFFAKTLVLLDDPFSTADSSEIVLKNLEHLAESQNPIAILAPKLLASRVKKIEALADKTFSFEARAAASRGFNGALIGALGARESAALWKEIVKALREGDAPEAVHGLLHWKARDMMQKGNPKWGKDGARKLSRELIELLSDSRSGDLPLAQALERFALSIR